jgi:hypothetical protein
LVPDRRDVLDFREGRFVLVALIKAQQSRAQLHQVASHDKGTDTQAAAARGMPEQILVLVADLPR